ncbi:hypothetical protein FRC20_007011, partial [Serendipita sp. 405]
AIPEFLNGFSEDIFLPRLLKRILPREFHGEIARDLERLGRDINSSIRDIGLLADSPPTLTQYSQWGHRIDTLHTSEGWRKLKTLAVTEGLVSHNYNDTRQQYGEYSRIYAFAKTLLFVAEGRVVGCPISMTDGCARVLELHGTEEMKHAVYDRLVSSDPSLAFTAGQFMTERPGGSDLSLTETVARPLDEKEKKTTGAKYLLDGFKWFSSATDSEVALALARTGDPALGTRSLSLFLLPLRLPLPTGQTPTPSGVLARRDVLVDGKFPENNGITIHRLKSKIGTHSLPTAELSLTNSLAYLVGPLNGGIKTISTVLQITRVHSAFHSVGSLARCLNIARSFANVRKIEGGKRALRDVPLHVSSLARVVVTYRAILGFAFGVVHLLGQTETPSPSSSSSSSSSSSPSIQARFRLLNPTLKAFATFHCVPAMEECMAALGGQGYMEENAIGRLIRDALVEKIWEGTENVLALDLLRASAPARSDGSEPITHWTRWAEDILEVAARKRIDGMEDGDENVKEAIEVIRDVVKRFRWIIEVTRGNETLPRQTLLIFGHVTSAIYLLEHAVWVADNGEEDALIHFDAFARWTIEGGVAGSGLRDMVTQFERRSKSRKEKRVERDRESVFGRGVRSRL